MSSQYNDLLVADIQRATKGETLDAKKNMSLFQRVAVGDTAARDEMIAGNMPLALTNVERFINQYPNVAHLRDDLTSAAFVGLVKAVNKMTAGCRIKRPENWNPTEYMGSWINREVRRVIEDEMPIRLPHESQRLARQNGQPIEPPSVINSMPERFETPAYEKELETRDLIGSCCINAEERTFFAMYLAEHTFCEIAAAIGRPLSSTYMMGKKLRARVRRKLEALRDK